MTNLKQVTPANLTVKDGLGWCLRFTQSAFGAPVAYSSARTAWSGQKGRHPGENPPKGVSVPIWFDHWGSYGYPAKYGNWGHVAVSLPDGRVFTSPMLASQLSQWDTVKNEMVGSAIYPSISALQKVIGGSPNYLGWSEFMNDKKVVAKADDPEPEFWQEEDEDDMWKPTVHLKVSGSGKFMEGTLAHPQIGLDLKPGEMREEITSAGKANVYRGFKASGDEAVVAGWQAAYAKGPSTASSKGTTSRDAYINMQAAQQQMSIDLFGIDGKGFNA